MNLRIGSTSTAAQLAPPPDPIPTSALGPVPARLHLKLRTSPVELSSNSSSSSSSSSSSTSSSSSPAPDQLNSSSSSSSQIGPNSKMPGPAASPIFQPRTLSRQLKVTLAAAHVSATAQDGPRRILRFRSNSRWPSPHPTVSAATQDDPHCTLRFHRSSRWPSLHPTSPQQLKMTLTASYVSTAAQGDPHRSGLPRLGWARPGQPNLPRPSPVQHRPAWHIL